MSTLIKINNMAAGDIVTARAPDADMIREYEKAVGLMLMADLAREGAGEKIHTLEIEVKICVCAIENDVPIDRESPAFKALRNQ